MCERKYCFKESDAEYKDSIHTYLRNQSVLQMQLARQSVKSFEQLWGPG